MSKLSEILSYNAEFVARKDYESYRTDRYPEKRMVILTCMDTRLIELLPKAMNLRNGDVKIIKNAGAIVSHPSAPSCAPSLSPSIPSRPKKSSSSATTTAA